MKTALLCGIALASSSVCFAQTPAASPTATPRSITLTGCVNGSGTSAQPITLANAMIVPSTGQPNADVATVSPSPGAVTQPTTQPPTTGATGAAGTVGATGTVAGTAGSGVGTAGTTGAGVGTAGTAGAGVGTSGTGVTGTAGTAGVAGTAGTAGTAGVTGATGAATPTGAAGSMPPTTGVTGTAPAGSSASSASGYRLSGADMTGFVGQRVQLVGSLVPAATGASSSTPGMPATTPLPEFRVVSVQPISGNCPPQQ